MTVIDWQSVARGRGAIDLALFLFGSLKTSTPRAAEGNLLWRYHALLVEGVLQTMLSQLMEDCQPALP